MSSLKHFSKNFPGGVIGIVALLLIIVAIAVASFFSTQGQKVDNSSAAASTSLTLTPSSQALTPGQNFTLTTTMNTSTNKVIGVDMEVNYDPSAIEILSVQKGSGVASLDQTIRNVIDNTAGSLVYGVFTLNTTSSISGSNLSVLTISGKVKPTATAGNKSITFNNSSKIIDAIESGNVLQTTTGASINVSSSTVTNTPYPTGVSISPRPTNSNAQAATVLSLTASNVTVKNNQTFPVNVQINTNTNDVIGADLDLSFDKTKMQVLDVRAGSFFTSPDVSNKVLDNTTGHAKVTVNIPPSSTAKRGTGIIAVVTFKAITEGPTRIDFGDGNLIGALNMSGQNALNSTTGLGFNVVAGLLGDINEDGVVDIVDYTILFANFGKSAGTSGVDIRADINNDGKINILDYTYVFENFGKTI